MSILLDRVYLTRGGTSVFQDLSLTVRPHTITLVVGETGAGKSTLLDLISGLVQPEQGMVLLQDASLWKNGRLDPMLSRSVSAVFQSPEAQLFANTVQAEFSYSLRPYRLTEREVHERAVNALEALGLSADFLSKQPLLLSGGQKRRVALATALATKADWLILDEPTAGLDSPSTRRLASLLAELRNRVAGGLLIATHDLDAFLPIADDVVVLKSGCIVAQLTPAALLDRTDVLERAGVGFPSQVACRLALAARGVVVPSNADADAFAEAIYAVRSGKEAEVRAVEPAVTGEVSEPRTASAVNSEQPVPMVEALDPRAKWLVYMALSIAMLIQHAFIGLAASGLVSVGICAVARVSSARAVRALKPLLFFTGFAVVLAGLQFGAPHGSGSHSWIRFDFPAARTTALTLGNFLWIALMGVLLTVTTSQLCMKRGLEEGLRPLAKIGVPIGTLALGTSLLLRFIPLIFEEVERFSRIVRVRGKSTAKPGRLRIRDLRPVVIPLMLSLLHYADELSLAMEARGYVRAEQKRTSFTPLQWTRTDTQAVVIGLILAALLVAVRFMAG